MFLTRQMCDKAILENGGTLKSVTDGYKNQDICDKTLDNYPHELEFVPECYKTLKRCDKAPKIIYVPELDKTQEMGNKAVHRCALYLILFLINIKLKKYVT